ncbi:MAG: hypothetical protein K0U93_03460 [Gammaproteobacteria bacterium]|nr:hypothetical protein [Gammaproteobacteria bacterium]
MQPADLSKKAVSRAVLENTAQHPLAVYPTVVGVLGGIGAVLFGPGVLTVGALVGGLGLGVGGWAYQYFARGDRHAQRFVESIQAQLERRMQLVRRELDDDFEELGDQRGQQQLRSFTDKFENFRALLSRQLDPNELTYQRYLAIAEQVTLAGLDNLKAVCLNQRSVSAIKVDELTHRLHNESGLSAEEKRALETRIALHTDKMAEVTNLYVQNEEALTQLDHVSAKIASIQTGSGHAQMDMEAAMSELRVLADRAERYNSR